MDFPNEDWFKKAMSLFDSPYEINDQNNDIYTDPDKTLGRNGIFLRCRWVRGKCKITMKRDAQIKHGSQIKAHEEIESVQETLKAEEVSKNPSLLLDIDCEPIRLVKEICPKLRILQLYGRYCTKRHKIRYVAPKKVLASAPTLVLEFDQIFIGEKNYFQLEVETDSPVVVREHIESIFTEGSVAFERSGLTKMALVRKEFGLEKILDDVWE